MGDAIVETLYPPGATGGALTNWRGDLIGINGGPYDTTMVHFIDGKVRVKRIVLGDATADERVNISDGVFLVNYVFKGGLAPRFTRQGDANCDTRMNISDAVTIINYVFKGSPLPSCP